MKKAIIILFIVPSLIYCQDIEKKTSKSRNSFMIDISYDSKLMNINEEYSIDVSETVFLNEGVSFCVGYSINADGNTYSFDNAVIGLDLTNVLHRLLTEEAIPALGLFLRVGKNNFYNHTEYTIGPPDFFLKLTGHIPLKLDSGMITF